MKTPWHLWLIGVLSLLWNLGGVFDYLMSQLNVESYMGAMTPEQRAYFDGFPTWAVVFWALGVWGALAGSVLLLLRSRYAAAAFAVSLIGLLVNTIHLFASQGSAAVDLMGRGALAFTALLIVVALGLWLYARAMARRQVLR
ncbi:hypothetical protein [Sinisalibacter aestuarii]|uniref:Sugar transporter n=1 Tax=Sinisalibacter aestuarii TaxID=2949426 RepID=A0ABQ5LW98_9RHOB|nr:hypothetical protein [Sinisalibacter aestuarii]GKY88893.1 hypothetical protein STA1M1_27620 [Sinisalibacter aestuarii]